MIPPDENQIVTWLDQLQKIEPAQVGIAEPLPDQGRVQDDVRSLRRSRDRLSPARLARIAGDVG